MKKFLTLAIMLIISLTSCKSKADSNEIIIGVPEPLTGEYAQYGTSIKEGIELKIAEINENGGINGKKVKAVYQDTKGDVQELVNIFKQMVNNGIDAVLGESISANSAALAELAQKAKIPMITPAGTALDITQDRDYVFRTTFTDPYQGQILAKYLKKEGVQDVALLVNKGSDYSVGVAEAFKKEAAKDAIKVYEENYTNTDKDFKTILTKIKNEGYKTVVIPDYYNTIGLILSQAKEIGLEAQYYGADGWDGIQDSFAKLAEGAIFSSQFTSDDTTPKVQEFISNYRKKFSKEPLIFAALGYDAMTTLESAFKKGGDLKEALKNTDLDLLTGHVKYDENGNPKKKVTFVQIKNGKQVLKEKFGE